MSSPDVLNWGHMQQTIPKLWIFVFLSVGILITVILLTDQKPQNPSEIQENAPLEEERSLTFEGMLDRGGNAIYLENQKTGSTTVTVGFVVLSSPGYVAIYDDQEGVPRAVIGASGLLDTGGEHFVIPLQKTLEDGQVYYAVIYADDGNGRFREGEDAQAVDQEDSVVLMSFIATSDADPESEAILP